MAKTAAPPFDPSTVVYNDLVVLDWSRDPANGFPIKSFSCIQDKHQMSDVMDLAKAFIVDAKLRSVNAGDGIPDLRLGRVCARKGTQESVIDYQFHTHKLGITPTPDPSKVDSSGLSGMVDSLATDKTLDPLDVTT